MHEHAVMQDLMREIERASDGVRVTRVRVRLGVLSHFTDEHFREHFADASRGTAAEGAAVLTTFDPDPTSPAAQGVVLESIDVAG